MTKKLIFQVVAGWNVGSTLLLTHYAPLPEKCFKRIKPILEEYTQEIKRSLVK